MVRVGGMSRPPTRQSRRLNGQSPSPPPPLPPERSSRADSNALHSVNSVEPEHQHSDLYEVQNDMDVIQELPNAESSIPELNFDDWGGSPPGGALAVSLRPEDQATIDQFMSEPDLSFLENALSTSSSPLYPLAPISADPSPRENSYFNVSPHIHSPRRSGYKFLCALCFPSSIRSTHHFPACAVSRTDTCGKQSSRQSLHFKDTAFPISANCSARKVISSRCS
ncbi:hypothetical protein R3P38DRAFT_538180 [Favolaschia claudopus]|uniref:Uncharacterized protein n=1 Tax=Favolaschia claudopus TaxID=2862362 RepID=A0AAW0CGI2_9AGAR